MLCLCGFCRIKFLCVRNDGSSNTFAKSSFVSDSGIPNCFQRFFSCSWNFSRNVLDTDVIWSGGNRLPRWGRLRRDSRVPTIPLLSSPCSFWVTGDSIKPRHTDGRGQKAWWGGRLDAMSVCHRGVWTFTQNILTKSSNVVQGGQPQTSATKRCLKI